MVLREVAPHSLKGSFADAYGARDPVRRGDRADPRAGHNGKDGVGDDAIPRKPVPLRQSGVILLRWLLVPMVRVSREAYTLNHFKE
jgi:hypothetical protein